MPEIPSSRFPMIEGTVENIQSQAEDCCTLFLTIRQDDDSIVHIIAGPDTYYLDQLRIVPGVRIHAFYDGNAPVPLIYPPQYRAVAIAEALPWRNVKVDFFGPQLISSDGSLMLNPSRYTEIISSNGQYFNCSPANRILLVVYNVTTRSIPAQTTPTQIIVLCNL